MTGWQWFWLIVGVWLAASANVVLFLSVRSRFKPSFEDGGPSADDEPSGYPPVVPCSEAAS